MQRTVEVLCEGRRLVELRALKRSGAVAGGYFDNFETLIEEAAKLDKQGYTAFTTLNPADSALLARAANRVERGKVERTSDSDVVRRRWVLVDADPKRPGVCPLRAARRRPRSGVGAKCIATSNRKAGRSRWLQIPATALTLSTL
jgi:hypothetical protein